MATKRALLVGAGSMGRAWARNLQACEETMLAGWVDIRSGLAEQAAAELGEEDLYCSSNLRQAITAVTPDFVVDVSSPQAHYGVTLLALSEGLPVLGEKPMSDSIAHAREMVTAAERAGKLFMVSQSRRYNRNLTAARDLIRKHIGPPAILNADFYRGSYYGGFREEMSSPLLLDMAIHHFDAARYLTDTDPRTVYCMEYNPPWSWFRGNASTTAIFEMTGGLHFTYRGSWCSYGHRTSWDGEWRAVGIRGTVIWDGHSAPVSDVVTEEGEVDLEEGGYARTKVQTLEPPAMPESIAGSLSDFLHALETGATPMGECHDNLKSLAMVFGAIESSRTGRRVGIA
jgi:predicted dehydrogenase